MYNIIVESLSHKATKDGSKSVTSESVSDIHSAYGR